MVVLSKNSLALYPLAVCNDGSPAAYYFHRASSHPIPSASKPPDSSTWLIYLAPGGWCYDSASCVQRCKGWHDGCSSTQWADQHTLGGIFDSPLFNAPTGGRVYLRYCTSDAHMGNASAFGLQFRGAEVVHATLTDLATKHGLGTAARTTIVFGGASAGARGGMVHLDDAERVVRRAISPHTSLASRSINGPIRVLGFLDSAMWVDMSPANGSAFLGFANITRAVHAFAQPHMGECASVYAGTEAWKCIFGQYRLPLLHTPYVAVGSQHDSYQLGNNLGAVSPATAVGRQFLTQFATRVESLADWMASSHGRIVYSSRCHRHATSEGPLFTACGCLQVSMQQALDQLWLNDSCSSMAYVDRTCPASSYNCSCCTKDVATEDDAAEIADMAQGRQYK